MKVPDFGRSFVTFRIDTLKQRPVTVSHPPPFSLNNARIQLECRCVISELETGVAETFALGASCKTERVGVDRDIWTEPNADFAPIFSATHFMNLKTYARCGMDVALHGHGGKPQTDRQYGLIAEAFDDLRIDLVERDAAELFSANEIVEATLANRPLMARTTIDAEHYTAVIDYPIKTMNANERNGIYQTDTGPVLFPALEDDVEETITGLELAFAAFNNPTWTDFLVRVPTEVSDDLTVQHYSRAVRVDCLNQVFAV